MAAECSHGRFPKGLLVDRELDNHISLFVEELLGRTNLFVKTPGVFIYSTQEDDLQVVDGGSGTVTIKPGHAVDSDGQWIEVATDSTSHSVPDDSQTYNVLIEFSYVDDSMGTYRSGFPVPGEDGYTKRNRSFTVTVTQSSPGSLQILLATVSNTGGTLTIVDKRGDSIAKLHIPQYSITEEMLGAPSPPPIPTRLTLSCGLMTALVGTTPTKSKALSMRPVTFYVKAVWGQMGSGGVGGPGTFTVSGIGWTTDEWAGQYLVDSAGAVWLVNSNTSEVLTLASNDTPADGDWVLGPYAPAYQAQLQLVNSSNDQIQDFEYEREIKACDSPVPMVALFPNGFELGTRVAVRVRSLKAWGRGRNSAWTAWQYITCQVTQIASAPSNVTLVQKINGVIVTCDSNSSAKGIEVAYTEDGSTPSWDSDHIVRAPGFTVQINTPPGSKVKVKVRYVDEAGQPGVAETDAEEYAGRFTLDNVPDGDTYKRIKCAQADAVSKAIDVSSELKQARGDQPSLEERLNELARTVTDIVVFSDHGIADDDTGSTTMLPETKEEGSTDQLKRDFTFVKEPGRKYLDIYMAVMVTAGGQEVIIKAQVLYGLPLPQTALPAMQTSSTSVGDYEKKTLSLPVDVIPDGDLCRCMISMKLATPSPGNPGYLMFVTAVHSETVAQE